MLRRCSAMLVTVPVAAAGILAAHRVAYAATAHDHAHARDVLESTGHGYMPTAWIAVLVAAAVLIPAGMLMWPAGGAPRTLRPGTLAAIPPAAFLAQEHLERLHHDGAFPTHLLTDRTVLLGLALQIPFAALAYLVTRVILTVADRVATVLRSGALIARPLPPGPVAITTPPARAPEPLVDLAGGRAPPGRRAARPHLALA